MAGTSRSARVDVLVEGYVRMPHVAGTVSLVRDADRVVIVDPGMVADRELILRPLRELGVRPGEVTDIVVGHHRLTTRSWSGPMAHRSGPVRPRLAEPTGVPVARAV